MEVTHSNGNIVQKKTEGLGTNLLHRRFKTSGMVRRVEWNSHRRFCPLHNKYAVCSRYDKAGFEKDQRPYWAARRNNKAYFLAGQCCTLQN